MIEGPALGIGHRHQPEFPAKALQGFHRIRKGRPMLRRIPEPARKRRIVLQATIPDEVEIGAFEIIGITQGLARRARGPVGIEDRRIAHAGRGCAGLAEIGQHPAFEIDQRADNIEGQNLEPVQAVSGIHRNAPGAWSRSGFQVPVPVRPPGTGPGSCRRSNENAGRDATDRKSRPRWRRWPTACPAAAIAGRHEP